MESDAMMGGDGGGGGGGRKDEDPLLGLRKVGMVLRARARAAGHVLTARSLVNFQCSAAVTTVGVSHCIVEALLR